ncbi:MAG: adenylate/guanylate cyclase domain-containing protein, partial [Acidimicrobiia bacterium]
ALGGRTLKGNQRAEESCQAHHTGVLVQGTLRVEMDDGSTMEVGPNEVFDIPPGHDGWVVGDDPVIGINWSGVRTWLPELDSGDRVLATLLFTDIVSSTETAVRLGDRVWRELLGRHNQDVRDQLDRYRGREVATTGDGFLAVFDGAARAVHAARAIRDRARALGLEIRSGVHTGEVEVVGDDVRGVAVHEAARISAAASAGEILVSSTTRQLVSGGDLTFEERPGHELKGLAEIRTLYAVV